ncbi:wax ester/triacylglycerol synthase domain-containing protein [Streptomyces triculaminicus]|uniref:wax ester/triacylglycerol synthase domain-containing protein n=1 Tax=Streptomyces triculaminicus TaxID=2816232 RepID=UPI0033EA78C4
MTPHTPPLALAPPAAPAADRPAGAAMPPLDAWLYRHQSRGAICMTDGVMAWFDGAPPSMARLRARVAARWGARERLCLTPDAAAGPRAWPRWVAGPPFAAEDHVVEGPVAAAAPAEAVVARLLAQPLGPGRPPWQLHLLPAAGGFALLLRAHHALLDGGSLITLLRTLLDAPAVALPGPRPDRESTARADAPASRAVWARALADMVPRGRPLPFHGAVDSRRAVAWSRLSMADLGAARDALPAGRASVNAVFLAATAGALRAAGVVGRLPLPGVCAMVPVDVRTADEAAVLGNRYATVRVPLPLGGDVRRRLATVDGFTRRAALKERARAQARLVASRPRRHGVLGDALGRYADSPFYSSLLCSSGSTYAGPLGMGSARLAGLAGLPPLSPGHPLAVTMFVHDTTAVVTVVTDHGHRRLADRLAVLIRAEVLALRP